jgi:hypothetical protein
MRTHLGRPWQPADDERLKMLVSEGASITFLAAKLKRAESVIRWRAQELGLTHLGKTQEQDDLCPKWVWAQVSVPRLRPE